MRLPAARVLLILSALLLIPLGVSAQLACCAGMASMDSMDMDEAGCGGEMDCCEKAPDDALARHCCEGGERLDRSLSIPQVCDAAPSSLTAIEAIRFGSNAAGNGARFRAPRSRDLLTLHAVLLI